MINKHNQFIISIVIFLAVFSACDRAVQEKRHDKFEIYLVADTTLSAWEAEEINLNSLVLRDNPFLTVGDIVTYSWSKHVVDVTPEVTFRLGEMAMKHIGPRIPGAALRKPGGELFVVTVGSKRIYLGTFWPMVKSSVPRVPHVMLPIRPGGRSFKIEMAALVDSEDPRADARIRQSLDSAGVLRD